MPKTGGHHGDRMTEGFLKLCSAVKQQDVGRCKHKTEGSENPSMSRSLEMS